MRSLTKNLNGTAQRASSTSGASGYISQPNQIEPRADRYSFGSLFWPVKRPELLRFIIQNIPSDMTYLLSDAAAMSSLESGEQDLALDEKRGKVVKFVPQWKVLNHPAVGIFVVSRDPILHLHEFWVKLMCIGSRIWVSPQCTSRSYPKPLLWQSRSWLIKQKQPTLVNPSPHSSLSVT